MKGFSPQLLFIITLGLVSYMNPIFSSAQEGPRAPIGDAEAAVKGAADFLSWLDGHAQDFAKCRPSLTNGFLVLCDGTKILEEQIQHLFRKSPEELVAFIERQGIKLEIMCKDSERQTFRRWCKNNVNRKFFKEVSSLHGQYLPAENVILLHSDAFTGSLVHEYLHYLQFKNSNEKFGRVYKRQRVRVQGELLREMDRLIEIVQRLEKAGKKKELLPYLRQVVMIGDTMMRFGVWQKLIDERNLFLLYVLHGSVLGVRADDIALARKNMGFLCKDEKLRGLLVDKECGDGPEK